MIKSFVIVMTAVLLAVPLARAESTNALPAGAAILQRVLANRPTKDFSLKARMFPSRNQAVPVELLVKNSADDTRTIYQTDQLHLLVIDPVRGPAQWFLRGRGELTGKQRLEPLLGSAFSYYDLALPFLRWPNPKTVAIERARARDCYIVEVKAEGEPYARVKLWVDKEFYALLRAEAFNEDGVLVKRIAITSFKKVGEVMVPKGLEVAVVPPGQSLPSQEKSRLDVFEGDYDVKFPAESFAPENFSAKP